MSETCWFWHSWGKWAISYTGDVAIDGKKIGTIFIQDRACQKCGFIQRHTYQKTVYDFSD